MNSYDVIIIGAGHNGLVTAAYVRVQAGACWRSNGANLWAARV